MLGADTTRGHCWRRYVIVPIVVKVGITVTGTAMLELTVGAACSDEQKRKTDLYLQ